MVIKGGREKQRNDEQDHENFLIARFKCDQPDDANHQNYKFSGHHIGQYCTDEKTFFTFENRAARGAVMDETERFFEK